MSVVLENIFDELLAKSPPPARQLGSPTTNERDVEDADDDIFRPSKRIRSKLFLDDPDEIESPPRASISNNAQSTNGPNQSAALEGVDSLFEDLDELEKDMASSKPFDLAAVRRDAIARTAKEAPSSQFSTKYAVQSSSPPRDGMHEQKSTANTAVANGKVGEKEKRPIAKLDEARLLGKDGLPALVQLSKDFKPKGKGHEAQDLNRLFSVYQFWAHKMFPKLQFSDVVNRVEKLCHQKRMHIALSVYRDQANGTINGLKPEDEEDEDKSDRSGDEHNAQDALNDSPSSRAPSTSRASSAAPDPPLSRPPSSMSNNDDFEMGDEFDFDAIMAMEEEMHIQTAANGGSKPATLSTNQVKPRKAAISNGIDLSVTEDEESLFNEMHGDDPSLFYDALSVSKPKSDGATSSESRITDNAKNVSSSASTAATSSRVSSEPDDEWAILEDTHIAAPWSSSAQLGQSSESVGEIQTQERAVSANGNAPSGSSASTNRAGPEESNQTGYGDEDWDDMYVDE